MTMTSSLAEEATENKVGHFAKLKLFCIAKSYSYEEALNLRGTIAPLTPQFPPPMDQLNINDFFC